MFYWTKTLNSESGVCVKKLHVQPQIFSSMCFIFKIYVFDECSKKLIRSGAHCFGCAAHTQKKTICTMQLGFAFCTQFKC